MKWLLTGVVGLLAIFGGLAIFGQKKLPPGITPERDAEIRANVDMLLKQSTDPHQLTSIASQLAAMGYVDLANKLVRRASELAGA